MEAYINISLALLLGLLVFGLMKPEKVIPFIPNPTRLKFLGLWAVLFLGISLLNSFVISDEDRAEMRTDTQEEAAPVLIEYEAMRQWEIATGGFGADILVDPGVTANELRTLMKDFDAQHEVAVIRVVSSRAGYDWLMDLEADMPEDSVLASDYLLYYSKNFMKTAGDRGEIRWFQEKGPLSDLYSTAEELRGGEWVPK